MNTIIEKIEYTDEESLERYSDIFDRAASILRGGGIVAFPTETVYGLGGNALLRESSKNIYAAKGRPSDNPLIVHIAEISEIDALVTDIPDSARLLMDEFWPGPMTLIFKKSVIVPKETTGGLDTVAIRMPSDPIARKLIRTCGFPIAAPSANLSGRPSPTSAKYVIEDMSGRADMIIDGGRADIGLESTIIDVTGDAPEVLRPGYISIEDIKKVINKVRLDPVTRRSLAEDEKPKAPGMKYRHYAPKAPMTLVSGDRKNICDKLKELSKGQLAENKKVGIICSKENEDELKKCFEKEPIGKAIILAIGRHDRMEEVAYNLFDALRRLDDEKVDVIFAETFSDGELGEAVNNRMLKAAGHSVIEA